MKPVRGKKFQQKSFFGESQTSLSPLSFAGMLPVRRRKSSAASTAPPNDVNSLANLRQRCAEKGLLLLSVQGRRATLLSTSEIRTRSPTGSTELQQPESSQILLSDDQLTQIQSIVTRTVEQSANEIATIAT